MTKKMSLSIVHCMMCAAFFLSCSTNPLQGTKTTPPVTATGPGVFGLSQLKGMNKQLAKTTTALGTNVNFDLGSIKGSATFYFLLYNAGKNKITNITLRMTDSVRFAVYPAKIDTLNPDSIIGMMPVVKVVAYHGTAIDGPGNRPLMPMGLNSSDLIISGTTKTSGGADTNVTLTAGMSLRALVMDITIHFIFSELDSMVKGDNHVTDIPSLGVFQVSVKNYLYGFFPEDTLIEFVNVGNVPITLNALNMDDTADHSSAQITPGGSFNVLLRHSGQYCISIDGDHTVFDADKFDMTSTGMGFFLLSSPQTCLKYGMASIPLVSQQVGIFPDSLATGCVSTDMPISAAVFDLLVSYDSIYMYNGSFIVDKGPIIQTIGTDSTEVPCDSSEILYHEFAKLTGTFWGDENNFPQIAPIVLNHVYRAYCGSTNEDFFIVPIGRSIGGTNRIQLFWALFNH
jgi:hypothetical protein